MQPAKKKNSQFDIYYWGKFIQLKMGKVLQNNRYLYPQMKYSSRENFNIAQLNNELNLFLKQ